MHNAVLYAPTTFHIRYRMVRCMIQVSVAEDGASVFELENIISFRQVSSCLVCAFKRHGFLHVVKAVSLGYGYVQYCLIKAKRAQISRFHTYYM